MLEVGDGPIKSKKCMKYCRCSDKNKAQMKHSEGDKGRKFKSFRIDGEKWEKGEREP